MASLADPVFFRRVPGVLLVAFDVEFLEEAIQGLSVVIVTHDK